MLRTLIILAAFALPARAEYIGRVETPWIQTYNAKGKFYELTAPRYYIIYRVYEWHELGFGVRAYTYEDEIRPATYWEYLRAGMNENEPDDDEQVP